MMRASKGNKEYIIDEATKEQYQKSGYDIYDDNGVLIAYGKGKSVPFEQYMELKKENEELKKQLEEKGMKKEKQQKKEGE